jgi:hypothetical protein
LRPSWFENGQLVSKAFRRSPSDEDGLSVASSYEAAKKLLKSGGGVARIPIAALRALGLTVAPTDEDHACIEGLPPYADELADENYNRALELADRLLEFSNNNIMVDKWKRVE